MGRVCKHLYILLFVQFYYYLLERKSQRLIGQSIDFFRFPIDDDVNPNILNNSYSNSVTSCVTGVCDPIFCNSPLRL